MLIIVHFSLMIAAVLCISAGVGLAMFGRKKKYWFKGHRGFNTAGLCLIAAGALMAFVNITAYGGQHLAGLHQWVGLVAFTLAAITLYLGLYSLKAANKSAVRSSHRWAGRVSGLALLFAITLGLQMIGIL